MDDINTCHCYTNIIIQYSMHYNSHLLCDFKLPDGECRKRLGTMAMGTVSTFTKRGARNCELSWLVVWNMFYFPIYWE